MPSSISRPTHLKAFPVAAAAVPWSVTVHVVSFALNASIHHLPAATTSSLRPRALPRDCLSVCVSVREHISQTTSQISNYHVFLFLSLNFPLFCLYCFVALVCISLLNYHCVGCSFDGRLFFSYPAFFANKHVRSSPIFVRVTYGRGLYYRFPSGGVSIRYVLPSVTDG